VIDRRAKNESAPQTHAVISIVQTITTELAFVILIFFARKPDRKQHDKYRQQGNFKFSGTIHGSRVQTTFAAKREKHR
jgi:hypothetical protein